ncbi:hypothetical protein [Helicobacter pametensis]|uniref:F0F1 ATP synthase subunit B family protein n=1 Tax=Helicobacter pametensis TaxID=95149 RepID=UPI00048064EE|nr:hypothetical protein [Helicobacter pametensis]
MRLLSVILLFSHVAFSAEVTLAQSDFIERIINFLLFFLIVWYLGSDKVKQIFAQRKMKISEQFEHLQNQEKELKKEIERNEQHLMDAQNKAKEIVANAKREAFLLTQQFDSRLDQDIKTLATSFDEKLKQEEKQLFYQSVSKIVDQSLESVQVSQDACMQILTRGIR